jgi:Uma2 family endonuclease
LIVEVLSPSTAKKDETIKFDIYQKEGVEYYILVYPNDEKAKVYTLKDGRYIKLGDYTSETISLDERGCFSKIDFSKVFKKI